MRLKKISKANLSQILSLKADRLFASHNQVSPIFILCIMGRTGSIFFSRLLSHHPQCVPCHIYEDYLRYRIVKYETLHTQTVQEVSRVLDFLNLDVLDFLNLDTSYCPFQTALNLPIVGSSTFGRMKREPVSWEQVPKTAEFNPLDRASDWTVADHKKFEQIAGKYMKYFDSSL